MPGNKDRDSLAVRTMVVAGEEVAISHPYVTDAQRAAAGRETVSGRTRALLQANRERAAARYAAGWLADGEEVQRVWRARDHAELRWRLGAGRFAVWAEADVLHVLWRGEGDRVLLGGGVSAPMWPVRGVPGLWEASLRIRRLDEAVVTLFVLALGAADLPFGQQAIDRVTWRGSRAPADHASGRPLAGLIREHVLQSIALRAARTVTVYEPPASTRDGGPLTGCVLADGESTRAFAQALEPAIISGAAPPVLLVGVHSAGDPANPADPRAREYIPRQEPRRFEAHLRFVTGEVIPWATQAFPVDDRRWVCAGSSNGAAWAIGAARQRPDVFGGVAAFSAGVLPSHVAGTSHRVRQYIAAGTLENDTRRANRDYAKRLRRARVPCKHSEWVGGHDPFWWQRSLPDALGWLLA